MNSVKLDHRYELVRLIGSGGMGSVYEGVDITTRRRVAIKVIHESAIGSTSGPPSTLRRFKREARAMRTLDTPHIVSALDTGVHPDTGAPYLVLELLEGEDLQRAIDRSGPLPLPLALKITAQACLGLKAAHAAGIVHRDIKPANVFLARRGDGEITVKLLDFGIAKILQGSASPEQSDTLTYSGIMLGSPYYMSPEQLKSVRQADHLTDIWSIGAVLYCALTGRAPHGEIEVFVKLIAAVCSRPPPPVRHLAPWVSPEAARIVERAMEMDPSRRFSSALEMLDALYLLLRDGVALREEMLTPLRPSPLSRATGYSDASTVS